MEYLAKKDPLFDMIAPAVEGLGYSIVELTSRMVEKRLHVILRVFSPGGVLLDDCANLHRLIRPRIEISDGEREVHLEVSSPGLNRRMKSADEMRIFQGHGIQYLLEDRKDWISGVLGKAEESAVEIQGEEGIQRVPIRNIRKMRLNDAYEIRR